MLKSPLPESFIRKKKKILAELSVPVTDYDDLSPKGSIDISIRPLIDEINAIPGLVTTSSCGGRVAVFAEGYKSKKADYTTISQDLDHVDGTEVPDDSSAQVSKNNASKPTVAGIGGKGGGGKWLFVSHDPVDLHKHTTPLGENVLPTFSDLLGMSSYKRPLSLISQDMNAVDELDRVVRFKFEPMILHILTASIGYAQVVLSAALQAGFRESGATNLIASAGEASMPMVAIRTTGLALESIIGVGEKRGDEADGSKLSHDLVWTSIVEDDHLEFLLRSANQRFKENTQRINRFRILLFDKLHALETPSPKKKADGEIWELAEVRRARMKAEGLERKRELDKNTN